MKLFYTESFFQKIVTISSFYPKLSKVFIAKGEKKKKVKLQMCCQEDFSRGTANLNLLQPCTGIRVCTQTAVMKQWWTVICLHVK